MPLRRSPFMPARPGYNGQAECPLALLVLVSHVLHISSCSQRGRLNKPPQPLGAPQWLLSEIGNLF